MLRLLVSLSLALSCSACAGDDSFLPDVNAAITDVALLDARPDVARDTVTLDSGSTPPETVDDTPVVALRGPEPIRVIIKIHLEDLVDYGAPDLLFGKYFIFIDQTIRPIAEAHGVHLSIHGNGDWWERASATGYRDHVAAWKLAGHEIAPHVHSVYRDASSGTWKAIAKADEDKDAWIDQAWQDNIDALHKVLPDHPIHAITPYGNDEPGIAARLAKFGISVLGGGHRNEVAESWFGHYPHHGWRIGAQWLEENKAASAVIIATHPQLDKVSSHGGGESFIDRSLGRMKLRFLQTLVEWLDAERTGAHDGRIMQLGIVVHDNQDLDTMAVTLEDWLDWLEQSFVGKTSGRGHLIAEYATESEVGDDLHAWYDRNPTKSHFHVATPPSAAGGASDLDKDENTITDADAATYYPYAFWGLAQLFDSPVERVVNWKRRVTSFASQAVVAHEIETGPRDGADVATSKDARRMWLLYREIDGSSEVDLTKLDPAGTWLVHDGRTGGISEVDGAVTVGTTPLVVEPKRARVIFTLNSHDWVFEDYSQDLTAWMASLHETHSMPLDIYFTDAVVQRLSMNGALVDTLAGSDWISTSFFFRPPTPFYQDGGYFDQAWFDARSAEVAAGTRTWEQILAAFVDLELDLRNGRPRPESPGGVALMQALGIGPTGAAGAAGQSPNDKALAQLLAARGVLFMAGKDSYDLGEKPPQSSLYWRPEHAPIRLWENVAVDHTDPVALEAHAKALLASAASDALVLRCGSASRDCAGTSYIAVKMHDSDFYAEGTPFKPVYENQPSPWTITGAERLTALRSATEQEKRRAVWQELVRVVDEDRTHYEPVNLESLARELAL